MPVITQPMFSVILNRCETVEASSSLSWENTHDKAIAKREMYISCATDDAPTIITAEESGHMLGTDSETHISVSCYTDWDFLLCDEHGTVLPSDGYRRQAPLVDGFEGVFWGQRQGQCPS